jgi:thiol:disulfide interchange protein DsbD
LAAHAFGLALALGDVPGCGATEPGPALTAPGVAMELVADRTAIRPGEPFRVGLRIRHEPGWHTYWRQPGIVGVPTSLSWELPAGFAAGPLRWPVPERVRMAVLTAWGYERDVLLVSEIRTPADLVPGQDVTLRTQVAWMACGRTCHPGWGTLALRLPVASEAPPGGLAPETAAWFAAADAAEPPSLDGWTASVSTAPDGTHHLRLVPVDPAAPLDPDASWSFFSFTPHVHSDEPQSWTLLPGGGVELLLRPLPIPTEPADALEGLVHCPAGIPGTGGRTFARVRAPWQPWPR